MVLSVGQQLGRYEIIARLDSGGGMGEVYKARDTRLPRTVAIKVLGLHLAGKSDLRQRFEREAHVISSLNHPHICILHDVGHQDGIDYLVMHDVMVSKSRYYKYFYPVMKWGSDVATMVKVGTAADLRSSGED